LAKTRHFALHSVELDGRESECAQMQNSSTLLLGLTPALFSARDVWVGALVPKRWAKSAVTRNMIKRQIYTVTRLAKGALPHAAYVVRLRTGFDRLQFVSSSSAALKRAVRQELDQLILLADVVSAKPLSPVLTTSA
jgi:ribonuclease P protein component